MDKTDFANRIEEYLGLFEEVKAKVGEDRTALALMQEVNKDMRMAQIRAERDNGNSHGNSHGNGDDEPATQRQKNYLKKLGVSAPKELTKKEASALIDEELGKESDKDSFREIETNIRIPWHAGNWMPKISYSSLRELTQPAVAPLALHYQYRLKGGEEQNDYRSYYRDFPGRYQVYGA